MKSFLSIISLILASTLFGQVDIADARKFSLGSSVSVSGIVTNGAELGDTRFIQDGSAGIACYPGSGSVPNFSPMRGETIQVSGELSSFNGLLTIDPITSFTITGSGTLPEPKIIKASEVGERTEGQLVRFDHSRFTNGGLFFTQNTWRFTSLGRSSQIYLGSGHELLTTQIPDDYVSLIGIVSQYNQFNGVGDYQILLRDSLDLISDTPIHITDRVKQRNTTGSSFDIHWTSDKVSGSVVEYGPSPAMGNFVSDNTAVLDHSITVSGLPFPGLWQWLRAGCIIGSDTIWSTVNYHTTMFPSTGAINTWFTQPLDLNASQGTDAVFVYDSMDDTLVEYIDAATATLDVAIYNNSNATLINAVNNAHARGVQVRFIAEGQNSNTALNNLDPGIPILFRTDGMGSGMHNKFVIIDRDDEMNAWVLQGSSNWTSSLSNDANNQFAIQDKTLAWVYTTEFEEMWGGSSLTPNTANSRFGHEKYENTPHFFTIGGVEVECYFSPTESVTDRIVEVIEHADQEVHFAAFSYTEDNIRNAMILSNPNLPGEIHGMIDQVGGSELFTLQSAGLDVVAVASVPGLLHHKYLIADKDINANDPTVLTGSHNFSNNAALVNDENTLIFHSPAIADQFYQDWSARRDAVVGVSDISFMALAVWPNPVHKFLYSDLNDDKFTRAQIFDSMGRPMMYFEGDLRVMDIGELPAGIYYLSFTNSDPSTEAFRLRVVKH